MGFHLCHRTADMVDKAAWVGQTSPVAFQLFDLFHSSLGTASLTLVCSANQAGIGPTQESSQPRIPCNAPRINDARGGRYFASPGAEKTHRRRYRAAARAYLNRDGHGHPIPSLSERLSALGISRCPEVRYGGPVLLEACGLSLTASPPFLPALAVLPLSRCPFALISSG